MGRTRRYGEQEQGMQLTSLEEPTCRGRRAGISLDSSTASNFTTSGGTLTLEGKTGLSLKEDGADVMVIDSDKLVTFPAVDEANAAFVIGHTAEHDDISGETPQLQVVGNVGKGSGSIGLIRYESGTDGPYLSFCRSDHDTIGTQQYNDDTNITDDGQLNI